MTNEPVATWTSDERAGAVRVVRRDGTDVVVQQTHSLVLLDADLVEQQRWALPDGVVGQAAVDPATGEVLIDTAMEVRLLAADGEVRWRRDHEEWDDDYFSGACWFAGDDAWAIVRSDFGGCEALRLDRATGDVRASILIETDPLGIEAIVHPDGWSGLSISEGQERVLAWWVRPEGADGIEWQVLTHDGEILVDVHPDGDRVLLTPHPAGFGGDGLVVRTWPELAELRRIPARDGHRWGIGGAFVGDRIVAEAVDERAEKQVVLAVAADDTTTVVGRGRGVCPGGQDSWLELRHLTGEEWLVTRHR